MAEPAAVTDSPRAPLLRQWDIFLFWLPLFASWLLMTVEGPLLSAAVNRLPNEVVMLAAVGITITLAVTIESPVINLLATATALVKDRASYEVVRRFTWHWMVLTAVVGALVAFTPLFDLVVRRWLGAPDEVAAWVRPGMQILTLWTPAIAWRRFLQGVLIRFNRTRQVAQGTAVRLVATAGTAWALLLWGDVSGAHLAATALMAGVVVEAIYASIAVRPVLQGELPPSSKNPVEERLTYRELFWFHLPLAGTAALALIAQPMVTFALARLAQPTLLLAAWPLIFFATMWLRAAAFSLPEAVIALSNGEEMHAPIRRFSFSLATVALLGTALFAWSPLVDLYLIQLQDTAPNVAGLASQGLRLFLILPAVSTLVAWRTGLLIHQGKTRRVTEAMVVNVLVTAGLMAAVVAWRWPGIPGAALALTVSTVAQLLYLLWRR
ncbi:MAG: hypothetical protein AAF657_31700 [Acidobacteriota bacterium]